ncbi:MAG TPA: hypothetical protein VFC61_02925, partial [Blastocatellia bacterium]|nr:hypothetical protein [Blastocatellia bacterium]
GLVWLAALVATFMIPPLLVWRRTPVGWWEHPMFAGVTGLTMLIICVMIDSLFNVTANLITLLVVGAVTSIIPQLRFPQRGGGSSGTGVARPAQSRWAALSTRRPQRQLNQPVHVREGTAV